MQAAHVPAQVAVTELDAVRETMDHVQVHALAGVTGVVVDGPGDDPTARGAEVDGGEDPCGHSSQRRNAAATPASTGTCRPVVWLNASDVIATTALATCSGSTSRFSSVRWA